MTEADLLSSTSLRWNDTIKQSRAWPGRVLLRTTGGARRLVLTPEQADILAQRFTQPATVPESLVRLLGANSCPPLNDYYELVLQAHDAGLLRTGQEPAEHSRARPWKLKLPPAFAFWLGHVTVAAGAVAFLSTGWVGPAGWIDWVAGWLITCAALSAGEALAACTLAGAGCEVRDPRLHWLTLLPHFRVDIAEAVMGGKHCAQSVAALRVAPVAAIAGAAAWLQPGWLVPLLVGLLYLLAPWPRGAATEWLRAREGGPGLTIRTGTLFAARREDQWSVWRRWWREQKVSPGLHLVGWILLAAGVFTRGLPGPAATLLAWLSPAGRLHPLVSVGIYTVFALVLVAFGLLAWAALRHWRLARKRARPWRAEAVQRGAAALPGDPAAAIGRITLFQHLSEDDRQGLAAVMQVVEVEKKGVVFQEDDPADAFYIVMAGELEVLKRPSKPAARAQTIGWLGPGQAFGEIALLEGTPRSATVRAVRASRLLRLAKEDFDRLVVGRVGAARVRELLQYAAFLGRLVFMSGWPFEHLVHYAQRCASVRVPAGGVVLKRGTPNIWFHLIYDGAFEARDGTKVLRRMGPGDYFGEISLLGDIEATADVVAIEESRCLTMSRQDFLYFFSQDYRIGLQFESQANARLGSNLFRSR